jgi:hypothetical protein
MRHPLISIVLWLALLFAGGADAARIADTSNTGTGTTPVGTVPAGAQSGDIAIMSVTTDASTNDLGVANWPSGFAVLDELVSSTTDGMSSAAGWKRLSGADSGSYTFSSIGTSTEWVVHVTLLRGRHATNPPVISTLAQQQTGQNSPVTITASGVTAVAGDDLIYVDTPDTTDGGTSLGHVVDGAFTELQDTQNGFATMVTAVRENVSAGATGSISATFTMSGVTQAGWGAWLIRVPAAPASAVTDYYYRRRRE